MSASLPRVPLEQVLLVCKNNATLPDNRTRVDYSGWFHCLTDNEKVGLTVISFAATISILSICVLAFAVFWKSRRHSWNIGLYEPLHILTLSLFIGDFLQATGSMMSIHWISQGAVAVEDSFCNAQGWVQTIGETGAALSNLVLCIFTLISVFQQNLNSRLLRSKRIWFGVISTVWVLLLIVTGAGVASNRNSEQPYIAPTPYWCWIHDKYGSWQTGNEYAWFWVTLAFAFIVYVVAALSSKRNGLSWDDLKFWKWAPWKSTKTLMLEIKSDSSSFSLALLWYPVIYAFSILPLSIVRWNTFAKRPVDAPSAPTMAVATIYALTGAYNVVLLLLIRRSLAFSQRAPPPLPPPPPSWPVPHPHEVPINQLSVIPVRRPSDSSGPYNNSPRLPQRDGPANA